MEDGAKKSCQEQKPNNVSMVKCTAFNYFW